MARQLCEEKARDMVSSTGFCYSDHVQPGNQTMQTHLANQIHGFVSDPEMYNLTTGMEMIGFHKNLLHQQQQQQSDHQNNNSAVWKSFFAKPSTPPSSSKNMNESCSNFYEHHGYSTNNKAPDFTSGVSETSTTSENLIMGAHDSWQDENHRLMVDDSSLRSVFPYHEGNNNKRPSQGLSLSLNSTNPSRIGLQSFELRQTSQSTAGFTSPSSESSREGYFAKSTISQQQQMLLQEDQYLSSKAANIYHGHFLLKNSRYLEPAQEILNEFCSLDIKQNHLLNQKSQKNKEWEEDNGGGSSKKPSLTSLEFSELQKRKTKLLAMLEEVDRRYRHYRNQMKAVVSSFEAVAGNGAATVYSALALKAMSRHFRCLKDGILSQLLVTRKTLGEKDPVAPGTTRGETPRLKVIDQALRQQRAFQQMNMMETHPWRPQRGLPERSVSVLRAWLFEHFLHPYPSDVDKHILARQTGLSRSQVSNWFINARVRLWKPMVEEMYLEEVKERENNMASSEGANTDPEDVHHNPPHSSEDQKPTPEHLVGIDSECASSIINNNNQEHKNELPDKHMIHQQEQCFGSVELDFSSYTPHHSSGMVSYNDENGSQQSNFNRGGRSGGVSLTLGLQQHGGSGVSLAFPPPTHQSSLFYSRDQIEDCQPVQYSLLDGEGQNLPYRNLMGAQLLHDLAG